MRDHSIMFTKINIRMAVLSWLIVTTLAGLCDGYKILVVFPNPSRSHGNLGDGLVRHLLKAGHEITYITPFVKDPSPENVTYIDVSSTAKIFATTPYSIEMLMTKQITLDQYRIFDLMSNISMLALDNENVRNFLENSTNNFDVVIAEWMFNELYSGFAAVYQCPLMWVFPFEPNFLALNLIDEPTHPAYSTNSELNIAPPFTFLERISNLWFQIAHKIRCYLIFDAIEEEIYFKIFGKIQLKRNGYIVSYEKLKYNASLMLSYSHYSLGQALSIPQNLVPVGGYHVDDVPPPLPKDLQKLMDESKEGVIYFSMGSNLKSKSFPSYILKDLIKTFATIKHTVIWKFEEKLTGYSDNVHILPWTPQQSILAHPNCILFITHGGLLSATEAVHFGVPIIGIPVFYDQFSNVDRAVERGFAKKVTLDVDFAVNLKIAIEDMIFDKKYSAKAKELSFIYHHRPVPPGKSVVHWVKHVVATRGALHLRSPALLVPWYQKLYLDLLALVLVLLACVKFCLTLLIGRCKEYRLRNLKTKVN